MGVFTECKAGCDWASSPMQISTGGITHYRMEHAGPPGDTITFSMTWQHCNFPCSPCPSPQTMTMWFRKWDGSGWGAWKKVRGSVVLCTPQVGKVIRSTGTVSFAMTAGVTYEREVFWCERGVFQVLAETDCTPGGIKPMRARRRRVIVT